VWKKVKGLVEEAWAVGTVKGEQLYREEGMSKGLAVPRAGVPQERAVGSVQPPNGEGGTRAVPRSRD